MARRTAAVPSTVSFSARGRPATLSRGGEGVLKYNKLLFLFIWFWPFGLLAVQNGFFIVIGLVCLFVCCFLFWCVCLLLFLLFFLSISLFYHFFSGSPFSPVNNKIPKSPTTHPPKKHTYTNRPPPPPQPPKKKKSDKKPHPNNNTPQNYFNNYNTRKQQQTNKHTTTTTTTKQLTTYQQTLR